MRVLEYLGDTNTEVADYGEASVNRLTNPVLDPDGKIPELKYCVARIEAGNLEKASA